MTMKPVMTAVIVYEIYATTQCPFHRLQFTLPCMAQILIHLLKVIISINIIFFKSIYVPLALAPVSLCKIPRSAHDTQHRLIRASSSSFLFLFLFLFFFFFSAFNSSRNIGRRPCHTHDLKPSSQFLSRSSSTFPSPSPVICSMCFSLIP